MYQVLTGIKFLLISDVSTSDSEMQGLLLKMYEIYSDFVSKNPFYEQDMPIRMSKFDKALDSLIKTGSYQ